MQSIKTAKGLKGKYVLVRADFNVPVVNGKVRDDMRIRAAYPTIDLLRKQGARVVLISHIGRESTESLRPVANVLKKQYGGSFLCIPELFGDKVEAIRISMKNGDVLLLENLRSHEGEKAGSVSFAKELARLGDFYVNEAFPVSHRKDASIVTLPKLLPAFAGLQFQKEVTELSKVLSPKHPFLCIQGGAKAETKIPLIKQYLKSADSVVIGGALANDFLRTSGFSVGQSAVSDSGVNLSALVKNKKLLIPNTVVVMRGGKKVTISVSDVQSDESIYDIGLPSIEALTESIAKAKMIVWNGPMGWYEGGYTKATEKVLDLLAKAKGTVIIAGGDTSVLVDKKKMHDSFSFVSTGGGATLEFLAKGTLPGITALK